MLTVKEHEQKHPSGRTYRLVAPSVLLQELDALGPDLGVTALVVQHLHGVKGQRGHTGRTQRKCVVVTALTPLHTCNSVLRSQLYLELSS